MNTVLAYDEDGTLVFLSVFETVFITSDFVFCQLGPVLDDSPETVYELRGMAIIPSTGELVVCNAHTVMPNYSNQLCKQIALKTFCHTLQTERFEDSSLLARERCFCRSSTRQSALCLRRNDKLRLCTRLYITMVSAKCTDAHFLQVLSIPIKLL